MSESDRKNGAYITKSQLKLGRKQLIKVKYTDIPVFSVNNKPNNQGFPVLKASPNIHDLDNKNGSQKVMGLMGDVDTQTNLGITYVSGFGFPVNNKRNIGFGGRNKTVTPGDVMYIPRNDIEDRLKDSSTRIVPSLIRGPQMARNPSIRNRIKKTIPQVAKVTGFKTYHYTVPYQMCNKQPPVNKTMKTTMDIKKSKSLQPGWDIEEEMLKPFYENVDMVRMGDMLDLDNFLQYAFDNLPGDPPITTETVEQLSESFIGALGLISAINDSTMNQYAAKVGLLGNPGKLNAFLFVLNYILGHGNVTHDGCAHSIYMGLNHEIHQSDMSLGVNVSQSKKPTTRLIMEIKHPRVPVVERQTDPSSNPRYVHPSMGTGDYYANIDDSKTFNEDQMEKARLWRVKQMALGKTSVMAVIAENLEKKTLSDKGKGKLKVLQESFEALDDEGENKIVSDAIDDLGLKEKLEDLTSKDVKDIEHIVDDVQMEKVQDVLKGSFSGGVVPSKVDIDLSVREKERVIKDDIRNSYLVRSSQKKIIMRSYLGLLDGSKVIHSLSATPLSTIYIASILDLIYRPEYLDVEVDKWRLLSVDQEMINNYYQYYFNSDFKKAVIDELLGLGVNQNKVVSAFVSEFVNILSTSLLILVGFNIYFELQSNYSWNIFEFTAKEMKKLKLKDIDSVLRKAYLRLMNVNDYLGNQKFIVDYFNEKAGGSQAISDLFTIVETDTKTKIASLIKKQPTTFITTEKKEKIYSLLNNISIMADDLSSSIDTSSSSISEG